VKEEILDRTLRRTRFGRGYGPAVRQIKQELDFQSHLFLKMHIKIKTRKCPAVVCGFLDTFVNMAIS
jgi:hypothetical protein